MHRLRGAIAGLNRDALLDACLAADVPAGPVNNVEQVLADPHVMAREMVGSFEHPTAGHFPALPLPFKFDGFDAPDIGRPPLLGEHAEAILAELGFDAEEVARLQGTKVVQS